jgi:hypothetical protein
MVGIVPSNGRIFDYANCRRNPRYDRRVLAFHNPDTQIVASLPADLMSELIPDQVIATSMPAKKLTRNNELMQTLLSISQNLIPDKQQMSEMRSRQKRHLVAVAEKRSNGAEWGAQDFPWLRLK